MSTNIIHIRSDDISVASYTVWFFPVDNLSQADKKITNISKFFLSYLNSMRVSMDTGTCAHFGPAKRGYQLIYFTHFINFYLSAAWLR